MKQNENEISLAENTKICLSVSLNTRIETRIFRLEQIGKSKNKARHVVTYRDYPKNILRFTEHFAS